MKHDVTTLTSSSRARGQLPVALCLLLLGGMPCLGVTRYAWTESPSPAHPYTNWTTAAHDIQSAINAATAGDLILVTNGTYATGGACIPGFTVTNRVCITSDVNVVSMNGPAKTVIVGSVNPGGGVATNALRCAYVSAGGVLSGFTLTNGHTRVSAAADPRDLEGGGAYINGGALTNSSVTGCAAVYGGGAMVRSGRVDGCSFRDNTASRYGGGLYAQSNSIVRHCEFRQNSSDECGGGVIVLGSTLEDSWVQACTVSWLPIGYGGGILMGPDGVVRRCVVEECFARVGGGISMDGGVVLDSTVRNNTATLGGGVTIQEYGVVSNCVITGNDVGVADAANGVGGAGVAIEGGGTLLSCTISGNRPSFPSFGGGIQIQITGFDSGQVQILDCTIEENCATIGGGVNMVTTDPPDLNVLMGRCRIVNNQAEWDGGGLHISGSSSSVDGVRLTDSLIAGNTATDGGGVACSYLGVQNCTIVNNTATGVGGGIGVFRSSIANSIIWSNQATTYDNWCPQSDNAGSLSHCCTLPVPGPGSVTNAPDFMDPTAGDYRLRAGSPCIDAGTNNATVAATDLAGSSRVFDGDWDGLAGVDMGCYEYDPARADSDGDGSSDSHERAADTDPLGPASRFVIQALSGDDPLMIVFQSSSNRAYGVAACSELPPAGSWSNLPGYAGVPGNGGLKGIAITNAIWRQHYFRLVVSEP